MSVAIAEDKGASVKTRGVAVDWISAKSEVMIDSGSKDSAVELDGLAGTSMEVTAAISVLLPSKSSMAEVLKDGGSVVIGVETIPLEITMLGAATSVSRLPMLVDSTD